MLLTCVLAVMSVVVGAGIGASRTGGGRLLGPIRAAGFGSGALAVFGQLLPEAVHDLGFLAIAPFAVALFGSAALERVLIRPGAHGHGTTAMGTRATVELGLVALAVHQLVEGVALGSLRIAEDPKAAGVALAITAHTVPLVAMFTLALKRALGTGPAMARAILLLVASVAGVLLAALPRATHMVEASHGWIHGAVAGLLLHAILHAATPVVGHGSAERSWNVADVLAALAGAGLVLLGILATESQHALTSTTTWLVLALSVILTAIVHRAWPHAAHMRVIGL